MSRVILLANPSTEPTYVPTPWPSYTPSTEPTYVPTLWPSYTPSTEPTYVPTPWPNYDPTHEPSYTPILWPSNHATNEPNVFPSSPPSQVPIQIPVVHAPPIVVKSIGIKEAIIGESFVFVVPVDEVFYDKEDEFLTITAFKDLGGALTDWVLFNSATNTFVGSPSESDLGNYKIRLIATNNWEESATDNFIIQISNRKQAQKDSGKLTSWTIAGIIVGSILTPVIGAAVAIYGARSSATVESSSQSNTAPQTNSQLSLEIEPVINRNKPVEGYDHLGTERGSDSPSDGD